MNDKTTTPYIWVIIHTDCTNVHTQYFIPTGGGGFCLLHFATQLCGLVCCCLIVD